MADQYPLAWPAHWPRTKGRKRAPFKTHYQKATKELSYELQRIGAQRVVLSTNLELRLDGTPYLNRGLPADPGVALYFTREGKDVCIPCDRWDSVPANIRAVTLTLEALRGIDRWGTGKMIDAAFTGFKALPYDGPIVPAPPWWTVLGVDAGADTAVVKDRYREIAKRVHPDRGGTAAEMQRLNAAYEAFQRERGLT